MLTVSLYRTDWYNLSDHSNLAVWQLKPFPSCLLLSCLSRFTCACLTAAQLFSYLLPVSTILPAPGDSCCSLCLPGEVFSAATGADVRAEGNSVCVPLPAPIVLGFGLWRRSWKYSPYFSSSLSTVLAHTTANSSLVVFPPFITFFSLFF